MNCDELSQGRSDPASIHTLELNEFGCYEAKIEESEKPSKFISFAQGLEL